ncbi:MAG: hypothetical protein QXD43_03335 [Candidatus Aenigmatarchaeota archaeon]
MEEKRIEEQEILSKLPEWFKILREAYFNSNSKNLEFYKNDQLSNY